MLFSRQPKLRHIFSPRAATAETVVCRPPGPGRGTVVQYLPALHAWELNIGTLNYIDYLSHCVPYPYAYAYPHRAPFYTLVQKQCCALGIMFFFPSPSPQSLSSG